MKLSVSVVVFLWSAFSLPAFNSQSGEKADVLPPGGFQFAGIWDCSGAFKSGKAHEAVFTGTLILNGTWLELTEQDIKPASGYVAKYLIGVDIKRKQLVEFDASTFGAAVYASDAGWQNGVLTMHSTVAKDAGVPYAADRFLYSITGKDSFAVDWQISKSADLNWVSSDKLACVRRRA